MLIRIRIIAKLFGILTFLLVAQSNIAQVVDAGSDKTSCDGTSFLYAIPPGGVWSTTGGATIATPNSQSTEVSYLTQGANSFTYTVAGLGSDVVVVTNNMVTSDAGADRMSSCLTNVTLLGSPIPSGGTGKWELKYPTPGVIIANSTSNITDVTNLPFGNTIFTWTVSANGCSATDEVSINNSTPENNDGIGQSACTNTFYIEAETPPFEGSGLWSQVSSPGTVIFSNPNIPGEQIIVPRGTSTVRWTVTYKTCPATKDFILQNNLPNPQAGTNPPTCVSNVTLNAGTLSSGEQGLWTLVDPRSEIISNASTESTLVTNLKQGTTTFIWTVNNGLCSLADSVQIVNNMPISYAGRDTSICGNTYTLLANIPSVGSGSWSCLNDPSVVFSNSNAYNATISNLQNSTYFFRWTVNNASCTAFDDVTLICNYVSISAGAARNVDCSSTLNLNATDIPVSGTGYWTVTFGNATIDNSLSNITVARNIQETARFKWTIISGGCTYSDEAEYTNQLSTQAIAEPDKSVCDNNSLLTANAPKLNETGTWTIENGSGNQIIEQKSLFQTSVSNLDAGINIFRWTIANKNCSTYDLLSITNNKITTEAGNNATVCSSSYNLNADNQGGTGYWTISSPQAVIANSLQASTVASNLSFGDNTFTWTRNDKGCTASDNVIVTSILPDIVFAGNDQPVCDSTATLQASNPPHGTGVWTTRTGTGRITNSSLYQTTVYQLNLGLNTFRWKVSYSGCSAYDDVNIYNNKIIMNAGTNQVVCNTSSAGLSATTPGSGQTGSWLDLGANATFTNQTLYNTNVGNLIKGVNTLKWTLSDGTCSSSAQITITNNTPDSAKVAADKTTCSNSVQLNAVAVTNGTGHWSGPGNVTFSDANNNNTNVSGLNIGANIFTWTVTKNACSLSANQKITNSSVTADIPAASIQVCKASHDVQITANLPTGIGASGVWTKISLGSANIVSPSNNSTSVTNLSNGETRFKWTVQNGICSAFDEIGVIDDYYDASASTVGSLNVCTNSTSVMGNPGPPSGINVWSSDNSAITFSNPSNVTSSVSNLASGTNNIFWTIINSGCKASTSFVINNYTVSTDAGDTIKGCSSNAVLSANPVLSGQTGYWTANNVSVTFANSLSPTSAISNIPQGISLLTWTITANGCSASDNVIVVNNSFTVTAGNNVTQCSNSTTLQGSDPLSGTGNWTIIQGYGLISSPQSKTTNVTNLNNGDNTFRWTVTRYGCTFSSDVTITNNLYIADVIPSPDVCVDSVEIKAVPLPAGFGATGVWTVLLGGGSFENNLAYQTTAKNMALGQNQFRWTVTKGTCVTFKNLNVNNNRVSVYAGPDQPTCESSFGLFATPLSSTGTGLWTGPAGITIVSPNTPGTTVNNLSRGPNTFTWTVSDKACTGNSTVTITNNTFDTNAGTDQEVTLNSTSLNGTLPDPAATGYWQVMAGSGLFSNYTNPVTTINNLGFGVNIIRWTATWKSCVATDDLNVVYNVAESYAGIDKILCVNHSTMTATPPTFGTGTWTITQGGGTFEDIHLPNSAVTGIPRGTNIYRWTVVAFGVSAFDEVSITNNSFDISAGTDQATCSSDVVLNAENAGTGTGTWFVIQGSGTFSDNYINNPSVSGLNSGTSKYVWWVDRNGCNTSDTVTILKYQSPTTANAGADALVCNKTEYLLQSNTPSVGTGLWSAENSAIVIDNPTYVKALAKNLASGPNTFWWTTKTSQCQSTDQVIISAYNSVVITRQPINQSLNEKGNLICPITATGGIKSYKWQKDGQDLTDDSRIVGSHKDTLTISNLNMTDAGRYTCVIEGYCNTVTSEAANLGIVSGLDELSQNGIKIYPNPSSGVFDIDFDNNDLANSIEIVNMHGQKVYNKLVTSKKEKVDLSNYGDGVYLVNIRLKNQYFQTKILIQK